MYKYIVSVYTEVTAGGSILSFDVPRYKYEFFSSTKLTKEEVISRTVKTLAISEKDYEFTVNEQASKTNEKLEADFITLEKNYESLWEENEKLKKQLEDKDKYIQRLNLEAQRWFDNCMDLMHPPKESE